MFLYTAGLAEVLRSRLWARDGEDRESGASALEWAIIAAISVVMATVIGAVIYQVVSTKAQNINTCANVAVGSQCAGGTGGGGTGGGGTGGGGTGGGGTGGGGTGGGGTGGGTGGG